MGRKSTATKATNPFNDLGNVIYKSRMDEGLTQDEFGAKYEVSGPAIFKFEKGYVRPSLDLWLRMAADVSIAEKRGVILWLRTKLPAEYQSYLDQLMGTEPAGPGSKGRPKKRGGQLDYSVFDDRELMRQAAFDDDALPKFLLALVKDDEVWALFKPTGHELNLMRDMFGGMGKGSKRGYLEALRLIREFTHSF